MNKSTVSLPKRPALKWHGGKWRLTPWLLAHMPTNHDVYVEPFGGSAAVLLQKPRSRLEVYNDLDLDVYNFFLQLRNNTHDLISLIKNTPYHKLEYDIAWNYHTQDINIPSNLELARRFYVRSFMSIMGPTISWRNGFRRQKVYSRGRSGNKTMKSAAISFHETSHLYVIAERLCGVFLECMDALDLMLLYDNPNTLMYLDPPYLGSTRSNKKDAAYSTEMMTAPRHVAFLTVAKGLQSMALISGYKSELYSEHLENHGWKLYEKPSRTNGSNSRNECLWLNEAAYSKLENQPHD